MSGVGGHFLLPLAASALIVLTGDPGGASQSSKPVQSCHARTGALAWIPGGKTLIGDDAGYPEERPAYHASVKGFWIASTEVTNGQFARFVAETGHRTTAEIRGDSIVFSPPGPNELAVSPDQWWRIVKGADWRHPSGPTSDIQANPDDPVVHVSLHDALAYAQWAGRRLPTEEEFERAAQAGQGAAHAQPAPDSANSWQGEFPRENLRADGYSGLAPVGCYKANAYGAHDLIGNAWEWTISGYTPDHGPQPLSLSRQPVSPHDAADIHVLKGGSFLCAPNYCARYRPAARHAQSADETASHIGFRTVLD